MKKNYTIELLNEMLYMDTNKYILSQIIMINELYGCVRWGSKRIENFKIIEEYNISDHFTDVKNRNRSIVMIYIASSTFFQVLNTERIYPTSIKLFIYF